jgi:hypothetical protein
MVVVVTRSEMALARVGSRLLLRPCAPRLPLLWVPVRRMSWYDSLGLVLAGAKKPEQVPAEHWEAVVEELRRAPDGAALAPTVSAVLSAGAGALQALEGHSVVSVLTVKLRADDEACGLALSFLESLLIVSKGDALVESIGLVPSLCELVKAAPVAGPAARVLAMLLSSCGSEELAHVRDSIKVLPALTSDPVDVAARCLLQACLSPDEVPDLSLLQELMRTWAAQGGRVHPLVPDALSISLVSFSPTATSLEGTSESLRQLSRDALTAGTRLLANRRPGTPTVLEHLTAECMGSAWLLLSQLRGVGAEQWETAVTSLVRVASLAQGQQLLSTPRWRYKTGAMHPPPAVWGSRCLSEALSQSSGTPGWLVRERHAPAAMVALLRAQGTFAAICASSDLSIRGEEHRAIGSAFEAESFVDSVLEMPHAVRDLLAIKDLSSLESAVTCIGKMLIEHPDVEWTREFASAGLVDVLIAMLNHLSPHMASMGRSEVAATARLLWHVVDALQDPNLVMNDSALRGIERALELLVDGRIPAKHAVLLESLYFLLAFIAENHPDGSRQVLPALPLMAELAGALDKEHPELAVTAIRWCAAVCATLPGHSVDILRTVVHVLLDRRAASGAVEAQRFLLGLGSSKASDAALLQHADQPLRFVSIVGLDAFSVPESDLAVRWAEQALGGGGPSREIEGDLFQPPSEPSGERLMGPAQLFARALVRLLDDFGARAGDPAASGSFLTACTWLSLVAKGQPELLREVSTDVRVMTELTRLAAPGPGQSKVRGEVIQGAAMLLQQLAVSHPKAVAAALGEHTEVSSLFLSLLAVFPNVDSKFQGESFEFLRATARFLLPLAALMHRHAPHDSQGYVAMRENHAMVINVLGSKMGGLARVRESCRLPDGRLDSDILHALDGVVSLLESMAEQEEVAMEMMSAGFVEGLGDVVSLLASVEEGGLVKPRALAAMGYQGYDVVAIQPLFQVNLSDVATRAARLAERIDDA